MYRQKKKWLLGEFEGRWATRHQDGGWGADVRDGVRTGVSERMPSQSQGNVATVSMDTSACSVVVICSDQPVLDRCVVFGFVTRWKEDFVSMLNRNFARL